MSPIATEQQILSVVSSTPKTGTAIAKELGHTKLRDGLKDQINKLVESGKIVQNTEGQFITYTLAVKKKASAAPVKGTTTTKAVAAPKAEEKTPELKLPEASTETVRGYNIEKTKEGKFITTPNGKKIKMNADDYLIVINNEPLYVVKDAGDALGCIREYTTKKGMKTFVVNDIVQSKSIGTKSDLMAPEHRIMFMEIKAHNKAA